MRIAFYVSQFPALSQTFVIRQVAGMIRAGHDVTVLTEAAGDPACAHETYVRFNMAAIVRPIRPPGEPVPARIARVGRFLLRSLAVPARWKRLRVAVGAVFHGSPGTIVHLACADSLGHLGNYDAVIAHFGTAGVRAMHLQQAGLLGGPLAVVFHGYDMSMRMLVRQYRRGYRALFGHAAALLPISQQWRSRLIGWGAPAGCIEVLRMGVDLDRLPELDAERPLRRPLRVLTVARLVEKKGLRYAIEGVIAADVPIRYEIIGTGPLLDRLRVLARGDRPDKQILFRGQQSEQEVFAALAEADVFLLPSVTAASGDTEGIPVSIMEAMALGVLVVATVHGGIPELLEDQHSGWLVPERDPAAIARVLARCGAQPTGWADMRRAARAAVAAGFSNASLDQQLQSICRRIRDGVAE